MLGTWSQGRVVQRLPVFSLYSVLATHSWGRPLVCVVEVKWVYLFKGEGPWIQLISLSRKVRDLLKNICPRYRRHIIDIQCDTKYKEPRPCA